GPRGKLELRSAPAHLLIGDESALPAIATLCEALAAEERAIAVIEVHDASDQLPVAAQTSWLTRGDAAPGGAELLGAALRALDIPPGTHGYLLGETRAMVTLRGVLEAKGVAHD